MGKVKLPDELKGTAANEIKDMFNLFDINSDGLITKDEFKIVMETMGHTITDEETDGLWVKFDIDENAGIDVYEFVDMIKELSHLMKPTEHEELCKAMRTLASKKKGKRHDIVEVPETVNAEDVRKMLGYENGPEPVEEEEINQFLADIGFP